MEENKEWVRKGKEGKEKEGSTVKKEGIRLRDRLDRRVCRGTGRYRTRKNGEKKRKAKESKDNMKA